MAKIASDMTEWDKTWLIWVGGGWVRLCLVGRDVAKCGEIRAKYVESLQSGTTQLSLTPS